MTNPRTPDPNIGWCPKCQAHSKYKEIQKSGASESWNSYIAIVKNCADCIERAFVPSEENKAFKIGAVFFAAFAVGVFTMGLYFWESGNEDENEKIIVDLRLFVSMPYRKSYLNWKMWAEERAGKR